MEHEAMRNKKEYTVGELAELAGVTVRTLHHFENKGLLAPRRKGNEYRVYGTKEVERLQLILLYRELDMPLSTIGEMLNARDFDTAAALEDHLTQLTRKRDRLDGLIESVQKTIASMKGGKPMKDKDKFKAFKQGLVEENEKKYGAEAREKYGDKAVDDSNARLMGLSKADYEKAQEVEEKLRSEVIAGLEDDNDLSRAARIAELHGAWLRFFWTPEMYSAETHIGLAEGYLADERFRAYYDAWAPGATEYLVAAIKKALA